MKYPHSLVSDLSLQDLIQNFLQDKKNNNATLAPEDQKHICLLLDLPSLLRTAQHHSGKTQAAKLAFTSISFTAEKAKLR